MRRMLAMLAGPVLVGAAIGLVIWALGRGGREPPEDIEFRNAVPHRCDRPGCDACEAQRRWLEANPGRWHGDLVEAGELGLSATPAQPAWPDASRGDATQSQQSAARTPPDRRQRGPSPRAQR